MQEKTSRRSNADRSQSMRQALIMAGRDLFVTSGYADTGTPEIVAAAGVTRGALYHHFADKAALFEAVVRAEAEAVALAIETATGDILDPLAALERGADAYLDAMTVPGRVRLLLVDGPAVLGRAAIDGIDRDNPAGTLADGLAALTGRAPDAMLGALANLLSAAFDRAAIDIAGGAPDGPSRLLLKRLLGAVPVLLAEGVL